MAKILITVLGTIGKTKEGIFSEALYYFSESIVKDSPRVNYVNTFPLFVKLFSSTHKIIPVYTQEALEKQEEVLKHHGLSFDIKAHGKQIDEKDFNKTFNVINELLENPEYEEIIVDVSHGFRHLPLLSTVSMLISNFKNPDKIKHLLFAKEIERFREYEVIDLHDYLDIANIAFILSTFESNYTLANHIEARKYHTLTNALNALSNDIMALNLNNLFKTSAGDAISELEKVNDIAIKKQAQQLKMHLEETFNKEQKRYKTYYKLASALFERNYLLASLSLLNESIRLYIKSSIKKKSKDIVGKVEKHFKNDLYKIGDFFKNLSWKSYEKLDKKTFITKSEYDSLRKKYPAYVKVLYAQIDKKRNNLAHANSKGSFKEIKEDIQALLDEYNKLCIAEKSANKPHESFQQKIV